MHCAERSFVFILKARPTGVHAFRGMLEGRALPLGFCLAEKNKNGAVILIWQRNKCEQFSFVEKSHV
jgi:hypothetical protein